MQCTVITKHGTPGYTKHRRRKTLIHQAASSGKVELLEERCYQHHTFIDAVTFPLQRTAMHYAARKGHADAIEFLHRRGSLSLDRQDANGLTPMHYAAMHNSLEVVKKLISLRSRATSILDYRGYDPINYSTHNWQTKLLKFFCRLNWSFVDTPFTAQGSPLHNAAHTNALLAALVLHRYGTEMHFVSNEHDDYPAKEKRTSYGFGNSLRRLYFSRNLIEVLFFTLEKNPIRVQKK